MKDVRPETVRLLEENKGSKHFAIGLSNLFLGMSPWAEATKGKNEQVGLHQTKILQSEGNHQQSKKTTY